MMKSFCPDLPSSRAKITSLDQPFAIVSRKTAKSAGRLVEKVEGTKLRMPPAGKQQRHILRRLHEQILTTAVWMDREAPAHHHQTFMLARHALARQLEELPKGTTAVLITDVDDMLVDSYPYFNGFISKTCRMSDERLCAWWLEQPSVPLNGAKAFLDYAASHEVSIHYITARKDHPSIHKATIQFLSTQRFPSVDAAHVHLAHNKMAKAGQIIDELKNEGSPAKQVFAGGDRATDIGFPHSPTRQSKRQWVRDNLDKVGLELFIQPNAVYGPWETTIQGRYEDPPISEATQRCLQIHKIAGQPAYEMKTTALEQGQAVLYSTSTEHDLAVRQVLTHGHAACKRIFEKGKKAPTIYVQLEGVLANTASYVADQIVQGQFADQDALQRGELSDWFDYGAAVVDQQVADFLVKMRLNYNAGVVYEVTVPKGADSQEYAQVACRWLRGQRIDVQPVVDTRPDADVQEHGLYLLTRPLNKMLPKSSACYIVPAPHQLWEWWQNDPSSVETTTDQLQHYVRRWQLPVECTSGASLTASKRQSLQEDEDDFLDTGELGAAVQLPPRRLPQPFLRARRENREELFLKLKVKPSNVRYGH